MGYSSKLLGFFVIFLLSVEWLTACTHSHLPSLGLFHQSSSVSSSLPSPTNSSPPIPKSDPVITACSANWADLGTFSCDSRGINHQTICGCLPPSYQDPSAWTDMGGYCFSHTTSKPCGPQPIPAPVILDCGSNWPSMGRFTCDANGITHQTICGCRPSGFDNLGLWRNVGGECYTHSTDQACDRTQSPFASTPHYFGYYAGAMDGAGPGDYIPELAQSGNFIFVESYMLDQKLSEVESLGKKAMVSLPWVFFDSNYNFRPDYVTAFSQYAQILENHRQTIIAFYGLDEPYANAGKKGIAPQTTYYGLETMGTFLKNQFPEIPIAVIFSSAEIKNNVLLPPSHDWFGMDCYGDFNNCDGMSIPSYYAALENQIDALRTTEPRPRFVMLVPPSGVDTSDKNNNEGTVLSKLTSYESLAFTDPRIKVVIPFLWQSFSTWIGTRELPNAKSGYEQFYLDFTK